MQLVAPTVPGLAALPILPLILVQGHTWTLKFYQSNGERELVVYGQRVLGSTETVVGVYQIVEAVGRLARWAHDDYRPWLERLMEAVVQGSVDAKVMIKEEKSDVKWWRWRDICFGDTVLPLSYPRTVRLS